MNRIVQTDTLSDHVVQFGNKCNRYLGCQLASQVRDAFEYLPVRNYVGHGHSTRIFCFPVFHRTDRQAHHGQMVPCATACYSEDTWVATKQPDEQQYAEQLA